MGKAGSRKVGKIHQDLNRGTNLRIRTLMPIKVRIMMIMIIMEVNLSHGRRRIENKPPTDCGTSKYLIHCRKTSKGMLIWIRMSILTTMMTRIMMMRTTGHTKRKLPRKLTLWTGKKKKSVYDG
jgi:hypothetical protein